MAPSRYLLRSQQAVRLPEDFIRDEVDSSGSQASSHSLKSSESDLTSFSGLSSDDLGDNISPLDDGSDEYSDGSEEFQRGIDEEVSDLDLGESSRERVLHDQALPQSPSWSLHSPGCSEVDQSMRVPLDKDEILEFLQV